MTPIREVYADNDSYKAILEWGEEKGGEVYLFLHLDVYNWNKKVLKTLRKELDVVMKRAFLNGVDYVSFYLPKKKTTKFHNLIRKLDFEVEMDGNKDYLVGGWYSGEYHGD
jgi:hypothetical protein